MTWVLIGQILIWAVGANWRPLSIYMCIMYRYVSSYPLAMAFNRIAMLCYKTLPTNQQSFFMTRSPSTISDYPRPGDPVPAEDPPTDVPSPRRPHRRSPAPSAAPRRW